jgi:hypothetical protein
VVCTGRKESGLESAAYSCCAQSWCCSQHVEFVLGFGGGVRGDLMLMSLAWEFGASSFEALEAAIGQSGFAR